MSREVPGCARLHHFSNPAHIKTGCIIWRLIQVVSNSKGTSVKCVGSRHQICNWKFISLRLQADYYSLMSSNTRPLRVHSRDCHGKREDTYFISVLLLLGSVRSTRFTNPGFAFYSPSKLHPIRAPYVTHYQNQTSISSQVHAILCEI